MKKIELWSIIYYYFTFHTKKKKIIYGPPKDKFLAPPLLAGKEIGNSATSRCDRRGVTRGSWVRGLIVGSWVRRSYVVGSLFVGSPFVGSWVRCSPVCRSWVRHSPVDDLVGGATISTFWVRNLSLSLFARVLSLSLSLFARLRKWFEGKILAKNIFRVKGLNFTVNENSFPKNPFSRRNQTPVFPEKTNTALGAREQCFFNSREGWISRVGPTVRPPSLRGERR